MSKIRQVFISHTSEFTTYPEKKSFIDGAIRAVNRARSVPCDMGYFTARDEESAKYCIDRVRECDVYVGIIGLRYGSPVRDRPEVSYTELEFEAATEAPTIKRFIFLLDPLAPVPVGPFTDVKYGDRQEQFRKRLNDAKVISASFSNVDELETLIFQALKEDEEEKGEPSPRQVRIDWPEGKSPYPGLKWFTEEYAPLFFGRDREVSELVGKLSEPGGRFLVISGPSGSGKSSLVGAGLWKALIKEGRLPGSQSWRWLRIRPMPDSRGLFTGLAHGLHQVFENISIKTDDLSLKLAKEPKAFVEHITPQLSQGQELVLFVDRLEALFTSEFSPKDIQDFLSWLVTTSGDLQSRLRVVATIQSEYWGRLTESQGVLQKINEGFQLVLGTISVTALRAMIAQPAEETKYIFESGLVDKILDEAVKEPGNLPLVAYALNQLFEERERESRTFTHAAYTAIGNVVGAIGTKADQELRKLGQQTTASLDKVFSELVHVESDRPHTPKRARLSEFAKDEQAKKVIRALAGPNCRVLVIAGDAQRETVELAHEKLLEAWPQMAKWLEDNKSFLDWRDRLRVRMRDWQPESKDAGTLLQGGLLEEAQDWFSRKSYMLTQEEEGYIKRSTEVHEREMQSKQQQAERDLIQANQLAAELVKRQEMERARAEAAERAQKAEAKARQAAEKAKRSSFVWVTVACLLLAAIIPHWIYIWFTHQGYTTREQFGLWIQSVYRGIHKSPEMVRIERDTFPIFMGKYEVTFEEYDRFAITEGRPLPYDQKWGRGRRPVINVSWDDARDYAKWLSKKTGKRYRLPTGSEWEDAAKGGEDHQWAGTSEKSDLNKYAWFTENSGSQTKETGETTAPNPFGLYDLSGNVWEWVEDCAHKDNKVNCDRRMMRGGSWDSIPDNLEVLKSDNEYVYIQSTYIGFRLAQDIEP